MLENLGYAKADGTTTIALRDEADIIVINTCSVRENADNRFFGIIGQVKKAKERDPSKVVAVCGCMMQQETIRKEIENKFSWVDIVFGTQNIDELPKLLGRVSAAEGIEKHSSHLTTDAHAWHIVDDMPDIIEGLPAKREYPFKAYVNIIYGCNNFCTYCIVPYTRGREKSRAPEAIAEEVRTLCADGVKEITLLGQNVNSYRGSADGAADMDFPDLIRLIAPTSGLERIRFMTSHPKDISDKLIGLFAELPNLCPAIHLPIQSGSTEVLRRMNRHYTKEDYLAIADKLREARPDIAITTDLIVGFSGETDEDFDETMDVIERVRFDSAFTFLYSPRTGTPAATYSPQIPEEIKHRRFNRMVARLNEITLEKNREHIGRTEPVLIESLSKTREDMLAGRTPSGKLVNFPVPDSGFLDGSATADPDALIGRIMPVKITDVNTFSFVGVIE
jgi:tRNA-2-methylthio-N6-dimethylallyladenosine synthase